jgi:4-hydroxybenzoate polyprenyltransferase
VRLATALRLGRVSDLPTVASNVLAAIALAGVYPRAHAIVLACFAMALMYAAGAFLNDAFDRDHDREHRPGRPIPAGEVHAAVVFDSGFVLLVGGIVAVAITAIVLGAGWKPVWSVLALGSLIVFYDASHMHSRFAPLVMTLCRLSVYTTAALLFRRDLCNEVVLGGGLLAAPFLLARPTDGFVAAISLLDGAACWYAGRPELAFAAFAAFAATTLLRRALPGT